MLAMPSDGALQQSVDVTSQFYNCRFIRHFNLAVNTIVTYNATTKTDVCNK
jgi:hypothetical protein